MSHPFIFLIHANTKTMTQMYFLEWLCTNFGTALKTIRACVGTIRTAKDPGMLQSDPTLELCEYVHKHPVQ